MPLFVGALSLSGSPMQTRKRWDKEKAQVSQEMEQARDGTGKRWGKQEMGQGRGTSVTRDATGKRWDKQEMGNSDLQLLSKEL